MSNTSIQLKKSGSTGNTPVELQYGELAVNYADGKLYYKDGTDSINYITNQDTFGTIYANGSLVLASTPTDTLTVNPANAITVLANTFSKTIDIGLDETKITSFVKKSGDTMTGDLNIGTANVRANVIIVNQTLYSGLATALSTPLPNLIAQFTGNTDSYVQVNAQNIDPHGSADYVVTADTGSDTEFYIDMGLNGSDSYDEENASAISPLDGYLYVKGSDIGQEHGNLILGTSTSSIYGLETKIVSGGLNEENVIATFSQTGLNVKNDLYVTGNITGPTIIRIDDFAQAAFDTANAGYVSDGSAYAHANGAFDQANTANVLAQAAFDKANTGGGTSGNSFGIITSSGYDDILANTSNSRLTFYAQTGIAIGNDVANSVISIGTNLIGASNVILDYGNVIDYLGVITFDYGYLT